MTTIQLISDLHQHQHRRIFYPENILPGADFLVLAGDLFLPGEALAEWLLSLARSRPGIPILVVLGNHDYYGQDFQSVIPDLSRNTQGPGNLHILQRDVLIFDDIRFLGTTLWTYTEQYQDLLMVESMSDYHWIKTHHGALLPEDVRLEYIRNETWLLEHLREPFPGKTVVISHHSPMIQLTHPRWKRHPLNNAFHANLYQKIRALQTPTRQQPVNAWLFGHTHDPIQKTLMGIRFVCNPYGYPDEKTHRDNVLHFAIDV